MVEVKRKADQMMVVVVVKWQADQLVEMVVGLMAGQVV